jgi:hypothetical protein
MLAAISAATSQISQASSFLDIAKVFQTLFKITIPGQDPPKTPDDYKDEKSDYGLKAKGIKAREALNAQCKEVLDRVKDPKDLTRSDIEVLKQYSGKGGLAEGSQYEYYTPQHVAEGCWDALAAQGFTGGNVLDPSTGAGMFEATKNRAAIITGCDLDATSSRIAQLLHPEEKIETKPFEQLTGKSGYSSNLPQRMSTDGNNMVTLSKFLDKNSTEPMPVRCSYSEKEIEIQQKLAQPFTDYGKLRELDKDFFTEYYSKMDFNGIYGFVGRDAAGNVGLYEYWGKKGGVTVVYPDTKDENLRKAIGTMALEKKRGPAANSSTQGNGLGYNDKKTLGVFFGANWESAIAEYGSKATQADVLKFMQEKWQQELDGNKQTEREYVTSTMYAYSQMGSPLRTIVGKADSLGDNRDEIRAWAIEARTTIEVRLAGIIEEIQADQEKTKLAVLKNHPDYKEVPENIKQAFDRMGIDAKVNTSDMILPGFKGGRGTSVPAFQRWFMQDRDGKQGRIFRMKDQLKGQFKAEYFADAGGEFTGSWWHVPATADLARIYELLA